jgi:L-fuconolactonase
MNTWRVDSHQHFWRPSRGDYGWLRPDVPELAPLCRDFLPEDLQPTLKRHQMRQTVLVQAAPSEAETDFLLSVADRHDFIRGVVGWVDMSREASIATLDRWSQHPRFRGIRPMLQDLPDPDWIATAPHPAVVDRLKRLGGRFDALVKPPQLEALLRFVRRHPELPVIVDHAAKPQLAQGWSADWAGGWRRRTAELARHPQVSCKFSGLLTEAAPASLRTARTRVEAIRPVWDHLLEHFGPDRLLWGSDWPVLTLAADYDAWVEASATLIDELDRDARAQIWLRNAVRIYDLGAPEGMP